MDRSTHEGTTPLPPWTPTQERLASVVVHLMTAANVWVYRLTGGWLGGGKFSGGRLATHLSISFPAYAAIPAPQRASLGAGRLKVPFELSSANGVAR